MFLHINHSQDQMLAMTHISKKMLANKIEALGSDTEESVKELNRLTKLHKGARVNGDDFTALDYLKYAIGENQYFESILIENKKYVWISRKKFMYDLPSLYFKRESQVSTLIRKYIDYGILEKHIVAGKKSKVFLTFTNIASKVLGKTMDDREFVRDILLEAGYLNKNNSTQKVVAENPQPQKDEVKDDSDKIPYKKIIDYLNKKSSKRFSYKAEGNKKHIKARWNEGYSLDDFKRVVDNKIVGWLGTSNDMYLRPETLFSPKFDGYLNENPNSNTSSTKPQTDLDREAIRKLEEIKKELPTIAIEENKILCNMEEVNALRAWREKNPTFYKELLGVDAKGEINLKDSAYVRHAIKERGYAKKFLTFVVNYTGRYGKVA